MTERRENRPSAIIGRVIGVIDSNTPIRERTGVIVEKNYDVHRTHIDGLLILTPHGGSFDLNPKQTEEVAETERAYFATDAVIKALEQLQIPRRKKLKDAAKKGVAGVRDAIEGHEVQIVPQRETIIHQELIIESLGDRKDQFVHETVIGSLNLDPSKHDIEKITAGIKAVLSESGVEDEEVDEVFRLKKSIRIDINDIQKLVKKGEMIPVEGIEKKIKDYRLDPYTIASEQEIRDAAEEAAKTLNVN